MVYVWLTVMLIGIVGTFWYAHKLLLQELFETKVNNRRLWHSFNALHQASNNLMHLYQLREEIKENEKVLAEAQNLQRLRCLNGKYTPEQEERVIQLDAKLCEILARHNKLRSN